MIVAAELGKTPSADLKHTANNGFHETKRQKCRGYHALNHGRTPCRHP